jgi:hypothetical protein
VEQVVFELLLGLGRRFKRKWVTLPRSSVTGVMVRWFQKISPFLRRLRNTTFISRCSSIA